MKKNVGTIDKLIRIAFAAIIAILYLTHVISGTLGIVLLILSAILVITSFVGICPLYMPMGLSTKRRDN
jgi:hypothetical protein